MKYTGLITKAVSLAVIVGCLGVYQAVASDRAAAIEQAKAEAKAAEEAAAAAEAAARAAKLAEQEQSVAEEPQGKYVDGTYEGIGDGFGGDIKVRVTVSGGSISDIDIYEHLDEDDEYFGLAADIVDDMIEANDPEVDIISGATFSSEGIIEAVGGALEEAVNQ